MPDFRKIYSFREDTRRDEGVAVATPPVKVAVLGVFANPYAGRGHVHDLSEIVDESQEIGATLSTIALDLLGAPVQAYGKAALVGFRGAIEHGVAAKSGDFGHAVRETTGGSAWLSSVVKRATPGTPIDVPLASTRDVWVRSHYDALTVMAPDAPLDDEIAIVFAASSGPRPHHRLGGLTHDEALGSAG